MRTPVVEQNPTVVLELEQPHSILVPILLLSELSPRVGSSSQAIGGGSEVIVSAYSTPSSHPGLQTGRAPRAQMSLGLRLSVAPSTTTP